MNIKHKVTIIMSDATMAEIARNLVVALIERARSRSNDDQKRVLLLQTELCAEWAHEREEAAAPAQEPEGK